MPLLLWGEVEQSLFEETVVIREGLWWTESRQWVLSNVVTTANQAAPCQTPVFMFTYVCLIRKPTNSGSGLDLP